MKQNIQISRVQTPVSGALSFPGDKSLSHRAIIFGSIADGKSSFSNVLEGEDCVCTRKAFEKMGIKIEAPGNGYVTVFGKGLHGLKAPSEEIYLGNSGTSIRLLLGLMAGQDFSVTFTGDPSLSKRPMRRVTDYLKQMGADVRGANNANFAPITIHGGKLKPMQVQMPMASAQVKSALLLAGLYADGVTRVTEPVKSRDHSELFLKHFGALVDVDGLTVSIRSGQKLSARDFAIAGDISSAAFFMAIAALTSSAGIDFKSVLWNPTRTGIIEVLKRMGIEIENLKAYSQGPEQVADFRIRKTRLKAFEIQKKELPALIDEIPILCVLATQAEGKSIIHDADELRVKETDRIHSMVSTLTQMGAKIKNEGNTIFIEGPTPLHAASMECFMDHRTAMSLIVAGMVAEGVTEVRDVECINTSFPNFFELLSSLGILFKQNKG